MTVLLVFDNYQQHQDFLKQFSSLISISINDDNFKDRLSICRRSHPMAQTTPLKIFSTPTISSRLVSHGWITDGF